jgi:hypothetical protein
MNVEIGAEAALFPEKEYINGIFVAVWVYGEEMYIMDPKKPVLDSLTTQTQNLVRGQDLGSLILNHLIRYLTIASTQ